MVSRSTLPVLTNTHFLVLIAMLSCYSCYLALFPVVLSVQGFTGTCTFVGRQNNAHHHVHLSHGRWSSGSIIQVPIKIAKNPMIGGSSTFSSVSLLSHRLEKGDDDDDDNDDELMNTEKINNFNKVTSTPVSLDLERRSKSKTVFTENAALMTYGVALVLSCCYPAWADGQTDKFRYPPIDYTDTNRCILKGSNMGQANAARDKLYDLRQCELSGVKAIGYDLSGVIMTGTDLSKANFREAYFSKGFLQDSNFDGADFSNAIVDRASFKGSSLKGAIFTNAVLTGTSFDGANVENADFTEAAIGVYDLRNLCKNPSLKGENPSTGADTRTSAGCVS